MKEQSPYLGPIFDRCDVIPDRSNVTGLPGQACSHPLVPRAHQAGSSRRSLAGVRLSESVRCHGPGLALLTNGGVQQHVRNLESFPDAKYGLCHNPLVVKTTQNAFDSHFHLSSLICSLVVMVMNLWPACQELEP
ncbi:hypothetical protein TNCV_557061 [Trichonephila clavipes]|uniref:Uncharacterized protein n=1 Tax=Trichonephila clavipes TaxID=2585209 RepID=A0A8X6UY45_TRICX|nr:hypothetical protein TNCV_557061 [Trichonephila clavipes]